MNLDSDVKRSVGVEHGKLLGKGKRGHRLEAASFHLSDRACVCFGQNSSSKYLNKFRKTEINKEHEFRVMGAPIQGKVGWVGVT